MREEEEISILISEIRNFGQYIFLRTLGHSFEDARLMMEAKKCGVPMETGLVEYHVINSLLSLNCDHMVQHLKHFALINTSKTGFLSSQEISTFLQLPHEGYVASLIDTVYNVDGETSISFRDYLVVSVTINNKLNNEQNIKEIFQVFVEQCVDDLSCFRHMLIDMNCEQKDRGNMETFREWCCQSSERLLLMTYAKEKLLAKNQL